MYRAFGIVMASKIIHLKFYYKPFRYDVNMRDNNSDQNLEVKANLPRRSHHTLHESKSSDFETLQAKCRMNALTSNLWKVERGI